MNFWPIGCILSSCLPEHKPGPREYKDREKILLKRGIEQLSHLLWNVTAEIENCLSSELNTAYFMFPQSCKTVFLKKNTLEHALNWRFDWFLSYRWEDYIALVVMLWCQYESNPQLRTWAEIWATRVINLVSIPVFQITQTLAPGIWKALSGELCQWNADKYQLIFRLSYDIHHPLLKKK